MVDATGIDVQQADASISSYVDRIQKTGYCVIPQAIAQPQVERALELVKGTFDQTRALQSDRMPFLNKDQPMLYNLQSKHPFFLELLFHSATTEGILRHFLNDPWFKSIPEDQPNYILRSYLARSSNYRMPMHIDSFVPYEGPFVFIMQCAFILEDQTEDNGCTVVVPGSHLRAKYATQEAFEEAIPIKTRAGDMVIWDSRIWHGAMANVSGNSRWSIIATFARWWIKQAFNVPSNLPQETYETLTDSQKSVLGFCSVPYEDETHGIDMKRSYDLLPDRVSDYRN